MARRPRRKAEDTRAEILATAERLFRENGVAGSSVAHIAQALSMSPANVFKHFHSKAALTDAICETKIDAMIRRIQALEVDAPAPQRLGLIAHRLMEAHQASLQDTPYMLEMLYLLSKSDLKSGLRYKAMLEDLFLSVIREGMESGVYGTPDAPRMARTAAIAFVSVLHPIFLAKAAPEELAQRCDDLSWLVNAALQNPLVK
ncbi:TetR family transcriptional regulator [Rhizobium sp. CSW-27]|uniref:TetR family transcriptional regulator n=1 Tax=Rhizobium sp. CSW-27 TaxID=2839985 RepID=UPI001C02EC33|nr:TetR family transcriptional regulator [Rhizobium sp. CSW-27]MBT9372753.1 TetR family transcriptional regulator [Rhizobium sp. CSW-27]